ncbi:hypothetical protein [Bailinhaonella thermotolerans]|uniref:hypothetical protein n=1 Tax=Bailinhaonella thermotolerans TaxID=1070861 RepID=UPI00192A55EF|nr:hypothetical protein [Bailinhaonella thermotolerans]
MMARFQCLDCGQRSTSVVGCRRCGTTTGRPIQHCPVHGEPCRRACRHCRIFARSHA